MPKRMWSLFFLLFLVCGVSFAVEEDRSLGPVPALVRVHVDGMEGIKPVLLGIFKYVECSDVWDIQEGSKEKALSTENIPALISALEKMNETAANIMKKVEPFSISADEPVKTAAERIKGVYDHLIKDNESAISSLRSFQEKPGTPEELQQIGIKVEFDIGGFTSDFFQASNWIVEAINQVYPDQERSGYPKEERAEIVKRLMAIYDLRSGTDNADAPPKISLLEGGHFSNAVVPLYEALKEIGQDAPMNENKM